MSTELIVVLVVVVGLPLLWASIRFGFFGFLVELVLDILGADDGGGGGSGFGGGDAGGGGAGGGW